MTEAQANKSGVVRFLTTVPGILTALAGLVTAAAGGYSVLNSGSDPERPQAPPPIIVNMTAPTAAAPPSVAEVEPAEVQIDASVGDLAQVSDDGTFLDEQAALCDEGAAAACGVLLDTLVDYCAQGSGPACDGLWRLSPEGSTYETYGATCGARVSEDFAGSCAEL